MRVIKFTNRETEALLHRLTLWDAMSDVFRDTDGLEQYADSVIACCQAFVRTLETSRMVFADENSDLHREVLVEVVEGSTWIAVHDPHNDTNLTVQGHSQARLTLERCAEKIAEAFGMDPEDISIPEV